MRYSFELRDGFTLLEVMVALSIISIALVSIFRLHSQTISMTNSVSFYTVAPLLAQKKIADIELDQQNFPTNASGDFGSDFQGYKWEVLVDSIKSEALGNIAQNIKQINISITFGNDEFKYHLRKYLFLEQKD